MEDASRVSLTQLVAFEAVEIEIMARDYRRAMAKLRQIRYPAYDNQFNYQPLNYMRARLYRLMGQENEADVHFETARAELEAKVADDPLDPRFQGTLAVTYAALGMREDALASVRRARELQPRSADAWKAAGRVYENALVWLFLGENDRALDELEDLMNAYYSRHNPRDIDLDPVWDPIRDNPRFQALVASHS
jgi:serine/threonine-protein kinase